MVREIPLSQGFTALVDDEDFDTVSRYKWCVDIKGKTVYAVCTTPTLRGTYLHRFVTKSSYPIVDHIDRNGLNNQKVNLREGNKSINTLNRGIRGDNTTGFKGVCKHGTGWRAKTTRSGKSYHFGTFRTKEEAAKAYDLNVRKLFGDSAITNADLGLLRKDGVL